jgi:hypothetical protein
MPPPRPSPPIASPSALELPDAKDAKPLEQGELPKLPLLEVPLGEVIAHARRSCDTLYYGIYIQNQKMGWGVASCGLSGAGPSEVLWERMELFLKVQSFGATEELRVLAESRFAAAGARAGELLRHVTEEKSGREEKSLLVERQAEGWLAKRSYEGGGVKKPIEERRIKALRTRITNGERAYAAAIAGGKLPVGKKVRYLGFDEDELVDQEHGLVVLASVERQLRGVTMKLTKLENLSAKDKVRGVGVHDAMGNLLEGSFQGAMRIRREEKETAKTLDEKATDFGLGLVIRAPMKLDAPGRVSRMVVRLHGVLPESLREHPRHRLSSESPGTTDLTVTRETLEGLRPLPLPVKDPALAEHLASTHLIEASHPRIRAAARGAVGDARDALGAARRLTAHVHKSLAKSLTTNLDSALAILNAGAGDCTEHARLLVALCRAVGLPAREVGGLTWGADIGGFGYHAWVEVFVGDGRWISADPAFDELPANATHIWMGGPNDARWIGTLGALSAKVIQADKELPGGGVQHIKGEEDGGIEDEEEDEEGGSKNAR